MRQDDVWQVVRFDLWIDRVFDDRLARERDIALAVAAAAGDEAANWTLLQRAHVYHASPAKDELPRRWHVDADLLARCPRLLCVSANGAGYDTIDVDACTQAGVAVVNQAGGNAAAVAELTIGLMIAVSRRIVESDRRLRTERGFSRESLMGRDISGKTLALVGIGHTGRRTAALARAFGMRVLAHDPYVAPDEIRARGAEPMALEPMLRLADIVSLHCPRDRSTLGLFDAARFAQMRADAIFVSTARGGIHDEAALAAALREGRLSGAGLDVWEPEPPAPDSPLLALPNVVATFHTAGVSQEARRNVAAIGAEQIVRLLHGERPARLVNAEVWDRFRVRRDQAR